MRPIFLFLLLLPVPDANGQIPTSNLNALLSVGESLEEVQDWNAEEIELDEQGQRTMTELESQSSALPEEEEDSWEFDQATCVDNETNALDYWIDAKAKKKKGRKKGRSGRTGTRCVPTKGRILQGCCLMYLRMHEGINSADLPTHARDIGPYLLKLGYCNVKGKYKNGFDAPINSLLVYSGGPSGHAEKKLAQNKFYFGPTNSKPASTWTTKKRTLTGIYVKCGRKKK